MITLQPTHMRRYARLARLLVKYGRSDLVHEGGLAESINGDPRSTSHTGHDSEPDPDQLARDLEALGPTYVKLGQLLSTRRDLVPDRYADALARLQHDVEPVELAEIESTIVGELGRPMSTLFASFEAVPLAAASIAQVHRAVLPDGGKVAVKVQRPGIRQEIIEDLDALADIAGMLDAHTDLGRQYGFAELLEEFRHSLLAELDHELEAQNLAAMGEHLDRFPDLEVPSPVSHLTTSKVLTMELVEGSRITDASPPQIDRGEALARQLFEAYLEQILVAGFVHADPHPGNVLLTDEGGLALIDLGMVTHLDLDTRHQLTKLLIAVTDGESSEVAELIAEMGSPLDGYEERILRRGITELVGRYRTRTIAGLGAGTILAELLQLAGRARLRLPAELSMVGKALLNLDDVTRRLDPDFRPLDSLHAVGPRLLRQDLSDGSGAALTRTALEAREFFERLPRRANRLLDALSEGELRLQVDAIDEDRLLRELEKVSNRVTSGLILAAIIVGAAMTMGVEAGPALFGYPAISIVFFLGAALGGLALMGYILIGDRAQRRRARP